MSNKKQAKQRLKKGSSKFSLRAFTHLVVSTKPKWYLLIIGIGLLMFSSGIQIYVPKLAATLVNSFAKKIDYTLMFQAVGMFVVSAILSAIGGTILGIFGENVIQNLRKRLWIKLTTLKVKYFDTTKAGETSSRLVNDTSQVKQLLAGTFPQTLSSAILVIGSIYMMFRMDWKMSLAMLVAVPVVVIMMIPIFTFGSKVGHMRQDALAEFSGIANETLSEIRLVKTSNAEEQVQKRGSHEVNKLFKVGRKEAIFDAMIQPFMMMIMMSLIFGLLIYGMHRIAIGEMEIGTLLSFLMYLFNLIGSISSLATLFTEVAKTAGATKRVQELLEEESEELTGGIEMDVTGKTLDVKNIDFAYNQEELILKNVSFKAKSNEVIAFAGPSGGGKSTIFSLLERFYEPTSGTISIGDTRISAMNLSNYRAQIGFVSQDSAIMAGTIRENLTYGLTQNFSDQDLWQVLELAYARGFVEEMPEGLNTEVGERGVKISGGQRQRIAIARAFLRNPKILMLDEATASLDSESEMKVQRALSNLMQGRTTLVIAHRLATIVDSDRIYFLEKGQITGSGTHTELVKTHQTYAKYVSEQFKTSAIVSVK